RANALGEGRRPLGAQERVGVVPGGEQRDLHAKRARGDERARAVDVPGATVGGRLQQLLGTLRRLLTGGVGVEERDDLLAVATEQAELSAGEGGAERGHGLREAELV